VQKITLAFKKQEEEAIKVDYFEKKGSLIAINTKAL
jgi:hypothetical protein